MAYFTCFNDKKRIVDTFRTFEECFVFISYGSNSFKTFRPKIYICISKGNPSYCLNSTPQDDKTKTTHVAEVT